MDVLSLQGTSLEETNLFRDTGENILTFYYNNIVQCKQNAAQISICSVVFRQPYQDLEGVDVLLVHLHDLVLVGHVDHATHVNNNM